VSLRRRGRLEKWTLGNTKCPACLNPFGELTFKRPGFSETIIFEKECLQCRSKFLFKIKRNLGPDKDVNPCQVTIKVLDMTPDGLRQYQFRKAEQLAK